MFITSPNCVIKSNWKMAWRRGFIVRGSSDEQRDAGMVSFCSHEEGDWGRRESKHMWMCCGTSSCMKNIHLTPQHWTGTKSSALEDVTGCLKRDEVVICGKHTHLSTAAISEQETQLTIMCFCQDPDQVEGRSWTWQFIILNRNCFWLYYLD